MSSRQTIENPKPWIAIKNLKQNFWYHPCKKRGWRRVPFPIFPWDDMDIAEDAQNRIAKHFHYKMERLGLQTIDEYYVEHLCRQ